VITTSYGLIPRGWTIIIAPVNHTDLDKDKPERKDKEDCNERKSSSLASIAFDMKIKDHKGRQRRLQDLLNKASNGFVHVELSYLVPKDHRDSVHQHSARLDYIYLENGDSAWKYLKDQNEDPDEAIPTFGSLSTELDHLTSMFYNISQIRLLELTFNARFH